MVLLWNYTSCLVGGPTFFVLVNDRIASLVKYVREDLSDVNNDWVTRDDILVTFRQEGRSVQVLPSRRAAWPGYHALILLAFLDDGRGCAVKEA